MQEQVWAFYFQKREILDLLISFLLNTIVTVLGKSPSDIRVAHCSFLLTGITKMQHQQTN